MAATDWRKDEQLTREHNASSSHFGLVDALNE